MARPRKNRLEEYAARLADEFHHRLVVEIAKGLRTLQADHRRELAGLRAELKALRTRLDRVDRRGSKRPGRWVPGGPGRPPKDAAERVAAFSAAQKKAKRRRR